MIARTMALIASDDSKMCLSAKVLQICTYIVRISPKKRGNQKHYCQKNIKKNEKK